MLVVAAVHAAVPSWGFAVVDVDTVACLECRRPKGRASHVVGGFRRRRGAGCRITYSRLVVRTSSHSLFVRCSRVVRTLLVRARTHPRTTRRAPLLSTDNNGHFALLLGLVVSPFYLLLELLRNSCCGIALVREHARSTYIAAGVFPKRPLLLTFLQRTNPLARRSPAEICVSPPPPPFTSAIPVCSPPA
jgi:hypothetical protein